MKGANKILTIAVVLLLLVNITMLVFMLKGRGHHPNDKGGKMNPADMMAKELNLTEDQKAQVKKLREEYFKNNGPVFDSIRTLKKAVYELAKNENVSDSAVMRNSSLIAEQQLLIDKATVKHFRTVRALFSGDQQKKYDEFVEKMMQRRMSRPGGWHGGDSSGKKE